MCNKFVVGIIIAILLQGWLMGVQQAMYYIKADTVGQDFLQS